MKDQQAYLDFAYLANAEVATLAKQLIAQYYEKPAAFSYFSGCSTGGREGMILSQRYPTVFNGIISGDPAMRTGLSNLAIGKWIPVAFNQVAPKDADGKPIVAQAITDNDRKLIMDALLKRCDAKDGVADGMISDPLGCDFDPAVLACKEGKSESCLSSGESRRDQESGRRARRPRAESRCIPASCTTRASRPALLSVGLLSPGPGIFGPATTAMEVDVEKEALAGVQPLVDSMSTNLTTFSGHGGKLIFYHGDSDPWFSPLDTFGYYKDMAAANGGLEAVSKWSQFYFVPGMAHCGGGPGLDQFDFLSADRQLGGEGDCTDFGDRDRQGIPRTQSTALSLSEARPLQGTGRHGRHEQLRMPLRRLAISSSQGHLWRMAPQSVDANITVGQKPGLKWRSTR